MSNVVHNIQTYPSTAMVQSWAVIRKNTKEKAGDGGDAFSQTAQVTS